MFVAPLEGVSACPRSRTARAACGWVRERDARAQPALPTHPSAKGTRLIIAFTVSVAMLDAYCGSSSILFSPGGGGAQSERPSSRGGVRGGSLTHRPLYHQQSFGPPPLMWHSSKKQRRVALVQTIVKVQALRPAGWTLTAPGRLGCPPPPPASWRDAPARAPAPPPPPSPPGPGQRPPRGVRSRAWPLSCTLAAAASWGLPGRPRGLLGVLVGAGGRAGGARAGEKYFGLKKRIPGFSSN